MKKVYYQLKMYQKSPLRVGSGDNEITDSDLMIDGRGCPFIPGSSIAGVLRDLAARTIPELSEKDRNSLFGYVSGKELSDSHVVISDAVGPEKASASDYSIDVRDGIRLDEWGITVPGNKYDFQVTETTQPYYSVLEWTGEDELYQAEVVNGLDLLMKSIAASGLSFGARTTRGYGRMQVSVKRKSFDFPADIREWLDFDPLAEGSFEESTEVEAGLQETTGLNIHVNLKIQGSFSVRVNTEAPVILEDGSAPDSVPLCNSKGKPVIPGTSWAGVFRHHMLAVLRQTGTDRAHAAELNRLFGMEENEGEHIRSAIRFSETVIHGGTPYSLTRNAVDRFTQAPRNAALFTDRFWQGGRGELEITIERRKINKIQTQLLAASLIDLDLGLLTFGGAAGTGHGRCTVTGITVNGQDRIREIKEKNSHFLEGTL